MYSSRAGDTPGICRWFGDNCKLKTLEGVYIHKDVCCACILNVAFFVLVKVDGAYEQGIELGMWMRMKPKPVLPLELT